MSRYNELHINIDESSMNLLNELNEKCFNSQMHLKELIRYCIQMSYFFIKEYDKFLLSTKK